jgi:uncharacterized protein YciI
MPATPTRLIATACACMFSLGVLAADPPAPKKPQQFVYVLRLAPALHQESNWTDKHRASVGEHFQRLKKATESGQVILAGRTTEDLDKTFGLVVFEADNLEAARAFMAADPAVAAGVMTATVHPYAVALQRKP